jgi:hypothetical protein
MSFVPSLDGCLFLVTIVVVAGGSLRFRQNEGKMKDMFDGLE